MKNLKKSILLTSALFAITLVSVAGGNLNKNMSSLQLFDQQELQLEEPVDYNGTILAGAGISLGYYNYGYLGTRSIGVPPINGFVEYGIHEFITVGAFAGFARYSYDYTFGDYTWTFVNFGPRGSVHITRFFNEVFDQDIDEEKIDWYVSLLAGLELRSYSSDFDGLLNDTDNDVDLILGPVTGVRYYINDNFAIYAEGGRGSFGWLTFGLSVKR